VEDKVSQLSDQMFSVLKHFCVYESTSAGNRRMSYGAWWLSGKFGALRPEGCRAEFHNSHHVGTLGKIFTCSCL